MPHSKDDAVMLTSGRSWHWRPLSDPRSQVRLLRLQPASDDDEISADVEIFDLDSAPSFKAISYTWGTEPPRQIIKIGSVPVRVRPNCHYALWQTRLNFPESHVWLDAICIDQGDLTEKAVQVAMMGDIYAKAANVLACIGPADVSSDGVRDALTNLDASVQKLPIEWMRIMDMDLWNPPQDEATTVRLLQQYNDFCQRPYFSRVWIVQELYEGEGRIIILCGCYQLDWYSVVDLACRLESCFNRWPYPPYRGRARGRIASLNNLVSSRENSGFSLLGLLGEIESFQCDDVRDRIFGTLRLVDWSDYGELPPVPDYQVSPLRLAYDLVSMFNHPRVLFDAWSVARALNLGEQSSPLEAQSQIDKWAMDSSEVSPPLLEPKEFDYSIVGARLIHQDTQGRLVVSLECLGAPPHLIVPDYLYNPAMAPSDIHSALAPHCLVPVYTRDKLSVLACSETLPGDILLMDRTGSLVVRAQDDGLSFIIIGQALEVNGHWSGEHNNLPECICWQDVPTDSYLRRGVMLSIEMSDKESIAVGANSDAFESGKIDMLTYLNHPAALGVLKRGAILTDTTVAILGENTIIGPPKAMCAQHRAAERYRISGQALWYSVTLEAGPYIPVKDDDDLSSQSSTRD